MVEPTTEKQCFDEEEEEDPEVVCIRVRLLNTYKEWQHFIPS